MDMGSSSGDGSDEERREEEDESSARTVRDPTVECHSSATKKSEATGGGVAAFEPAGAGASVGDMTEEDAEREVAAYLKKHGISDVVKLEWLERDMCQVPSMRTSTNVMASKPVTGKLHLVRGVPIRRQRLKGLLDHEIGTHFLRAYNELTRRSLPLAHMLPGADGGVRRAVSTFEDLETEEGLATLNTHFSSTHKVLWSPALSYFVQARSRDLGFTQVFLELKQFIPSAASRWAFCMRSKRGMRDTSKPGCMAKDRAYLQGALKILTRRRELDFAVLHSGKIAVSEHAVARKHLRSLGTFRPRAGGDKRAKLVTPHFITDMDAYLKELDAIAAANGVSGDGYFTAGAPSNGPMLNRTTSSITPGNKGDAEVAKPRASARRMSMSSLGAVSMVANTHCLYKPPLARPVGAAATMAAKLEEENARSRAKSRSKTEKRLHGLDSKREESRRETLEKCFSKRSRWGGLAFSWD